MPLEFEEIFVESGDKGVHHFVTKVVEIDFCEVLGQSGTAVSEDIAYNGDVSALIARCLNGVPTNLDHFLKGSIQTGIDTQDQNREALSRDGVEGFLLSFKLDLIGVDLLDITLNRTFQRSCRRCTVGRCVADIANNLKLDSSFVQCEFEPAHLRQRV